MLKRLVFCAVTCLAATRPLAAAEPRACIDPGYDWFSHTSAELRLLADQCTTDAFTELNYHRAYFRDLTSEADAAAELIDFSRSSSRANFENYAFYIMLVEKLAPLYFQTAAAQLEMLNNEYEINNEIAELWLRGYDNLVARLTELHSRRTENIR